MAARILTAVAAALLLVSPSLRAQSQSADPPSRVGRLSAIEGSVQQRTPDDNDWVAANLNYPVTSGFAIAPQDGGRAEIQVGSTAVRVGQLSELDVTTLADGETSLTLAQGELNVRVGQLPRGEHLTIATPRGIMEILAAGQYHLDAGTTESPTRFEVFNGHAVVQRDGGNTDLANGQAAIINSDDSLNTASAEPDQLDQWAFDRDRSPARPKRTARSAPPVPYGSGSPPPVPYDSQTTPYVSPEMTGGDDLAAYGNWNTDSQYGSIWYPRDVPADWAPYTSGHWSWVSPWGWTWIDDEPWGFAPFHYGRWAYTGTGWGWVPGGYADVPVYSPALVVFFGGGDSSFYYGGYGPGVGWCPLGPGELFVPSFSASVAFVRHVNITNVNINQFNITRVNNTIVVNHDPHWGGQVSNFANHRFATVVPANRFGQSVRVRDVAIRNASVTTAAARLPVSRDPAVAPPRTAAGTNATTNRTAQFNRAGRPPLPQSRTTTGAQPGQPLPEARTAAGVQPSQRGGPTGPNAPTRTIAGHTLPALPPAHGNATSGPNAPSRFGATTRTPTANANRGLPPVPSGHGTAPDVNGNRGPQGVTGNNAMPTGRSARGPFGTTRPSANTNPTPPGASTSSAGHGLPQLPTTRQSQVTPPAPQNHIAQPPTQSTGSSGGHRGFAAPATPQPQRSVAAPTHNFSPPAQPQRNATAPTHNFSPPSQPQRSVTAPTHNFSPPPQPQRSVTAPTRNFSPPPQPQRNVAAPTRNFSPPPQPQRNMAAPAHVAPPAAPARPVGNAAVSHAPAPAPHAQSAPHPANNKDPRKNQN